MKWHNETMTRSEAAIYEDTAPSEMLTRFKVIENVTLRADRGQLAAVTGSVGCGKTTLMQGVRNYAKTTGRAKIANVLTIAKDRVGEREIMTALMVDLSDNLDIKIPRSSSEREDKIFELMEAGRKPVLLCIDDAHDLPDKTLDFLSSFMDRIQASNLVLSTLLTGLPRLAIAVQNLRAGKPKHACILYHMTEASHKAD